MKIVSKEREREGSLLLYIFGLIVLMGHGIGRESGIELLAPGFGDIYYQNLFVFVDFDLSRV